MTNNQGNHYSITVGLKREYAHHKRSGVVDWIAGWTLDHLVLVNLIMLFVNHFYVEPLVFCYFFVSALHFIVVHFNSLDFQINRKS